MSDSTELRVPASHPSLPGHFPGNPVVPGVLILDLVAESILASCPDKRICGFAHVKFLSPLAPDTGFRLTWAERADGHIDFFCAIGDRRLAQGRAEIEAAR